RLWSTCLPATLYLFGAAGWSSPEGDCGPGHDRRGGASRGCLAHPCPPPGARAVDRDTFAERMRQQLRLMGAAYDPADLALCVDFFTRSGAAPHPVDAALAFAAALAAGVGERVGAGPTGGGAALPLDGHPRPPRRG